MSGFLTSWNEAELRWFVGDVQGCALEFDELLRAIRFDPGRDELWCLGDLINRGPDSLAVLRLWRSVGGRAILGNHEIKALLSVPGTESERPTGLEQVLRAPDAEELLGVLRALPVLVHLPPTARGREVWIVHAGLHPQWTDLSRAASELNDPSHDDSWLRSAPVQFATNVRCCTEAGRRSDHSGPADACPQGYRPWDSYYQGPALVVHGHWAARGYYRTACVMGLDSACVHGGSLTAWCQEEDRIVQIPSRRSGGIRRT